MKRKVIRQGHNTLTITLPKKWVDRCNLKPGSEVDISEQDENLVIRRTSVETEESSVEAEITGLDRTSVLLLLQGYYRYGYD